MQETHIVMEFCDCGSLEDATTDGRLADSSGADVDLELLSMTLLEVAKAMEYLHRMHITHRDLKLANVLLKSASVRFKENSPSKSSISTIESFTDEMIPGRLIQCALISCICYFTLKQYCIWPTGCQTEERTLSDVAASRNSIVQKRLSSGIS